MSFNTMHTNPRTNGNPYPDVPPPYTASEPALPTQNGSHNFSTPTVHPSPISSSWKPIAIPATSSKLGSPFLRAFPPVLEAQYHFPREVFLRFLDDLNRAAVASPPVQVLGLVGGIVSMVPEPTAQIVGTAVDAAADVATSSISKTRSDLCVKKANQELFQPRGLKVELAKLDAVARYAQMPILNSEGKIDKDAPILRPLEDALQQSSISAQQRRLQSFEPWIAPLDFLPLPELHVPDNLISRMHASTSEHQRKKEEKKMAKDRLKAHEDWQKDSKKALEDYEKEVRKIEKERVKVQEKHKENERELEKRLNKLDKEKEKCEKEYTKEMSKVNKDRHKDDKEEKSVRKVLWVLITPLDHVRVGV